MTIALLATGDEIVHGDTLNTNSHHMAQILSSEGLSLGLHLACSDKENEIYDSIRFLAASHDIIIITGGLGPTSDDRTRFALARFLNEPLVEFPEAIDHIQNRLCRIVNLSLSMGNRQQALFPARARLLPNPNGTAMGCYHIVHEKILILLPGPPKECLPMFNHYVLPLLQQTKHSDKQIFKWRLFGVAESQIAHQIDEALAGIDCKTGYRTETPYVECKVRCKSHLVEQVMQIVEPIIKPHLISSLEQTASEQLSARLVELKQPITIIDEVTGGLLQTLLQQPANYPWLKFYETKASGLHFHLRGLQEYWEQEQGTSTARLTIEYHQGEKAKQETHEIPFRSSLAVYYAAEWLSFRLFHLINQLHQSVA